MPETDEPDYDHILRSNLQRVFNERTLLRAAMRSTSCSLRIRLCTNPPQLLRDAAGSLTLPENCWSSLALTSASCPTE